MTDNHTTGIVQQLTAERDDLQAELAAAKALLREAIRCNRLTLPDDWWTRAKEVCGE